ncbi:MAG: class I SAM-dependent methyltransferase [Bdellovibrio bacteriovorus]
MNDDQTVSWERTGQQPPSGAIDATLVRLLLNGFKGVPVGFVLWDGTRLPYALKRPVAWLRVHDRQALVRLALNPDLQLGELYSAGRLEVEGSLVDLAEAVYRVAKGSRVGGPLAPLLRFLNRPSGNRRHESPDNIRHHYDIGNDFYRLWLDEQLVYTCAYFPEPSLSLEQAQIAKMDHICRKLDLKPGERVIEAGCGWGALALHMARHYGARVRAYNISRSQIAHARERAQREGLADRVDLVEGDYREIAGDCDVFVSIGMLEHVGRAHYRDLGAVIDRVLGPQGRGLIHSIGAPVSAPLNPWIERHIFPGAYTPTLREMMAVLEPFRFSVLDVENLRLHYARTLAHWLARFEAQEEQVRARFDGRFVRLWRLYLSGSIAAFRSGALDLFQVLFNRAGGNAIPWTRSSWYRP